MTQVAPDSAFVDPAECRAPAATARLRGIGWPNLALGIVAVAAGALNVWNLGING